MSREALDRAATIKALIQAEEDPEFANTVYDADSSNTIIQVQRESPFGPSPALADMIWDNGGNDTISSGASNDWLIAGRGADAYDGGSGFDMLAYVRANTAVRVDMSNADGTSFFRETNSDSFAFGDTMKNIEGVVGSRFDDTIRGLNGGRSSYINGFDGNDAITGGSGADVLKGGKGDDRINLSGGGGDRVFGGEGDDGFTMGGDAEVSGGLGNDDFVFLMPGFIGSLGGRPMGEIVITDFDIGGDGDELIFQGISVNQLHMAVDGDDIVLTVDGAEGSIRLLDTEFVDIAGDIRI